MFGCINASFLNMASKTSPLPEFTASDVGATVVVGMLIVFSVLAIIFLSLVIMERVFRPKKAAQADAVAVTAPFGGVFEYAVADGIVQEGDVVAVVSDSAGTKSEILSPASGKVQLSLQSRNSIKKGEVLFTIETGEEQI